MAFIVWVPWVLRDPSTSADLMTVIHRIHTGKKWVGFGNKKQWLPAKFRNPLVIITKKATDKAQ